MSLDSFHDELAQPGAWSQPDPPGYNDMAGPDCMGQSGYIRGFDDAYAPEDSTWGYILPINVLAAWN